MKATQAGHGRVDRDKHADPNDFEKPFTNPTKIPRCIGCYNEMPNGSYGNWYEGGTCSRACDEVRRKARREELLGDHQE